MKQKLSYAAIHMALTELGLQIHVALTMQTIHFYLKKGYHIGFFLANNMGFH